jgi:hypothetical protein
MSRGQPDNSDQSAGQVPVVEIELCVDVSDVDFLDASGVDRRTESS